MVLCDRSSKYIIIVFQGLGLLACCGSEFIFWNLRIYWTVGRTSSTGEGILGEWRYRSTHSLTSALDGGEWPASRPGRFTPSERAPDTHWIGSLVGARAGLDAVVKRKIHSPRRESNPRTPIVQPVAQRYTDWTITALRNPYNLK
jgi:hypothetical protein